MVEGDVLQDDDGMLRWILFEESFEVGAAGRQDHFVSFACLSVAGQCHLKARKWRNELVGSTKRSEWQVSTYISEALFITQVLERRDHVVLEVIPFQEKLLLAHLRVYAASFAKINCKERRENQIMQKRQGKQQQLQKPSS